MRRKIYDKLTEWKKNNGESALLIKGARRVGKSYIVEQFAKAEYKSYILIDFNQASNEVKNKYFDEGELDWQVDDILADERLNEFDWFEIPCDCYDYVEV